MTNLRPRLPSHFSFAAIAAAVAGSLSAGVPAQAEPLGVPMQAVILGSDQGDTFAFRANKAYTARPDGFYQAFFKGTEVVVYDRSYNGVQVTFVSDCRNYEGGKFQAYLACDARYDAEYDRWVAVLDAKSCTTTDPGYATSWNFNQSGLPNAWYFSGRTGYYSSQSCQPMVAVRVDGGRWLVDPINGTHDFRPQVDSGWTPETLITRR